MNVKICRFILLVLFWGMMTPLRAQVDLGLQAAVNFANLTVDEAQNEFTSLTVLGVGGVVWFQFQDRLSLQFQPMFLRQGSDVEDSTFVDVGDIKLDYLYIPVMLNYNLVEFSEVIPYLSAGPGIGFLLRAKNKLVSGDDQDLKDLLKSIDITANFVLGLTLPAGAFVEFQIGIGLANILKNEFFQDNSARTNSFRLLGGFRL